MFNRTLNLLLGFAVAAQCPGLAAAQTSVELKSIFEVSIEKDVAYLGEGRTEKADLYLPSKVIDADRAARLSQRPGVIIIHGGGWATGDKGAAREINIGTTLASQGYVCMSINYLLQPKEGPRIWPRNLHDCKTAVRWLRANSSKLQLDTEHIGVIGGSAGGHLALMLGLTDKELAVKLAATAYMGEYAVIGRGYDLIESLGEDAAAVFEAYLEKRPTMQAKYKKQLDALIKFAKTQR